MIRISPEKSQDPKVILKKESERIRTTLAKYKSKPYYLDIGAKQYSTEAFSALIEKQRSIAQEPDFLIGGAYGVDLETLSSDILGTFSLSPMTFPHSLALLVLLEQLYRVSQIRKNTHYHHA